MFIRCITIGLAWALALGPALSAAAAVAEEPLHLEVLISEALANNPDLLAARKRMEAARVKAKQATGLPAPKIGVEFEEIPRGTVKFNEATAMYQLIQALPFPGKLSARRRVAVAEAQMAAMAFKQAEWSVVSQVKTAYYDLVLLDRELTIQAEQRLWVNQAAAVAQTRYVTGEAAQVEALRAQAEALTAANALTVLRHHREALAAHLNHLLNRPVHSPIGQPVHIALVPLALTPDELSLIAHDRQPELLLFKYSAERADAALRLAKRELLPDLETMLELRDPAMGPIGPWDLTLALVLPFWFWTKLHYGVKVAVYDRESAQAAYRAMENEITKRIHEHWHEALAAYQTARLAQDGLIALKQQAVASAAAAYQSGRGSFLELLEALRALRDQERAYAQDLVAFEEHVVMLEQAAGILLRPAPIQLADTVERSQR